MKVKFIARLRWCGAHLKLLVLIVSPLPPFKICYYLLLLGRYLLTEVGTFTYNHYNRSRYMLTIFLYTKVVILKNESGMKSTHEFFQILLFFRFGGHRNLPGTLLGCAKTKLPTYKLNYKN